MRLRFVSLSFGVGLGLVVLALVAAPAIARGGFFHQPSAGESGSDALIRDHAEQMIEEGRQTFRFDTFGSERFFGDTIQLHRAIAGEAQGGVGPGLSPRQALALGLKVDADALPQAVLDGIKQGTVNLDDPATTLTLLRLNAVVGVTGFFTPDRTPDRGRRLNSVGIQCALCHSTVNDRVAPGIGSRLDGWANRDLNVGAIIGLAPDLSALDQLLGVDDATTRKVLASWGPGKFDAELILDGKGFRPDGLSAATLIPPAFGLAGVNLHTWTGWGSVPHWNAFVANLEMHGSPGTFYDPRLDDSTKFPIATRNRFGHVSSATDRITPKLAALHFYQLSIPAPPPPQGSFDRAAARRGGVLFAGKAACATCHVPPLYTEPGWNLHTPAEIGIDDFQASRSPDGRYRTAPLKGLWTHTKGGFYHDGRFATLEEVVRHYNTVRRLNLADREQRELVEFLKSLGGTSARSPTDPTDPVTAASIIPGWSALWLFGSGVLALGWVAHRRRARRRAGRVSPGAHSAESTRTSVG